MQAQKLFQEGKLDEAVAALNAQLRDDPTDTKARTFLFELLCFAGEYERADKQLDLLARHKAETKMGGLLYRAALQAERTRRAMFLGEQERPGPRQAATVSGTFNGREFKTITDADPRLGGQLEVIAAAHYMWIPWEHVESIEMEAPKKLRDLFWAPAVVHTAEAAKGQDLGEVLLPALSPLTCLHPDGAVRLGRMSVWERDEEGAEAPYGQKMLLVDGEEFSLLDLRELKIETAASSAPSASSASSAPSASSA